MLSMNWRAKNKTAQQFHAFTVLCMDISLPFQLEEERWTTKNSDRHHFLHKSVPDPSVTLDVDGWNETVMSQVDYSTSKIHPQVHQFSIFIQSILNHCLFYFWKIDTNKFQNETKLRFASFKVRLQLQVRLWSEAWFLFKLFWRQGKIWFRGLHQTICSTFQTHRLNANFNSMIFTLHAGVWSRCCSHPILPKLCFGYCRCGVLGHPYRKILHIECCPKPLQGEILTLRMQVQHSQCTKPLQKWPELTEIAARNETYFGQIYRGTLRFQIKLSPPKTPRKYSTLPWVQACSARYVFTYMSDVSRQLPFIRLLC